MATVSLIQMLAAGVVTPTTGVVLASGVCRFYQPGTLTPQTVYSDNAGATPISPPLILTAGGTGIAYTLNPIRCIIKDATDTTTLYDINVNTTVDDDMYVTSASFNGGVETRLATILDAVSTSLGGTAGYWKYKFGTSERNIKDAISGIAITPQDYGALGDGSADDTAAFLACAAAQSSSAAAIYIPPGTYQLSAAITFAGSRIVRGSGIVSTVLRGTNATMDCIIGPAAGVISDLSITHATTSTGTAFKGSSSTLLTNINIAGSVYANGANSTSGTCFATNSTFTGSTAALVGTWDIINSTAVGGTLPTTTVSAALALSTTTDMANGGSVTPQIVTTRTTGGVFHNRIRGTSAGGGTVNATTAPASQACILVLDCFNNSGGAFTFTLNAQYHSTGNPAPANGTRRVLIFAWDVTGAFWVETGRSSADVT